MLTGKLPFGNPESLTELHALTLDGNFDLPEYMSEAGKDLFVQIFNFKPQKRITLEQLWAHPWFTGFTDDPAKDAASIAEAAAAGEAAATNPAAPRRPPADFDYTLKLADLDMRCVSMATKMAGASESAVVRSVLENMRDSASATYFLLLAEAEHKVRAKATLEAKTAKEATRERRLSFSARTAKRVNSSTGSRGSHAGRAHTALRRRSSSMSSDDGSDAGGGIGRRRSSERSDRAVSVRPRLGSTGGSGGSASGSSSGRDRSSSYSGRERSARPGARFSRRVSDNSDDPGGSRASQFAPSPPPAELPHSANERRSARARSGSYSGRGGMRRSQSDSATAGGAAVREQVGRMRERASSGSVSRRPAPPGSGGVGSGSGAALGSARGSRQRRNSIGAMPDVIHDARATVANLPPLRGGGGTNGDGVRASKAPPISGKAFRQYETTVVL